MSERVGQQSDQERVSDYMGTYDGGVIRLDAPVEWKDGTRVVVSMAEPESVVEEDLGPVILVGFGLAGRWVADIFDRHGVDYVIVDQNPETIEIQRRLGLRAVQGDISEETTLREAGIEQASILVLTIPDEQAVLRTTQLARKIRPDIYIVARTNYTSAGLRAAQLGANEVIKGEQAVARQFYEKLLRKLGGEPTK
jgi:voltage-gated potassium channel Kch